MKQDDGSYLISKSGIATSDIEFNSDRFKPYEKSKQKPVTLIPWIEDTTPRIFVTETSKTVNYDATSVEFEYSTRNIAGSVTATETDPDNIISAIATENNIRGIPTVLVYKNGEVVGQHTGAMGKSELMSFIEQYL